MSRHRLINGKLDELPINWEWVPLGDILSNIIGGGTPSKNNPSYWQGRIPWLTIKDMRSRRPIDSMDHISEAAVKESATNIIPADTVIIATRVGLGKVIRVPYDATINQDLKALIPKEGIDKSYLEYWIVSIASYLESIGSGTTVKGVRLETLREIPFPLAPPNEQTRIVAEIEKQFSRLDEAVANLKRVKANLKRYKAAVLKAAVEGKLTEEWRRGAIHRAHSPAERNHQGVVNQGAINCAPTQPVETGAELLQRILEERRANWQGRGKYKEPVAPDTARLAELPAGWLWISVEQIASVGTGATPLRSKSEYYQDGKVPWITSGALNEEFVHAAKECITDLAVQETNVKTFPVHTLVVAMYGEGKTRGKVSELLIAAATNQACAAIILEGESSQVRDFVKLFFLKNYEDIRRLSSGGVQPNLNLTHIKKTLLPLPPLDEQNQIVAEVELRLSIITEAETQLDANLRRSVRLRQSILKKAFTGNLI